MGDVDEQAFTVRDGLSAGWTPRQLRGKRFQAPFHGVRIPEGVQLDSTSARATAFAVRMSDHEFFSHSTAAALHGIPLPSRLLAPEADLQISVFAPHRAPQLRGVRSHELKPTGQLVVTVGGLRAVGPEDTWVQLAADLTVDDLVVAADYLLTGDEPYSGDAPPTTLERLDSAIGRHGRMRGVRSLRAARDLARYGSLSPQETRMRLLLTAAGLPEPELNLRVFADETMVAMVDLAYPEQRVAIEYLGDHHRTRVGVYRDDILRRERLAAAGWTAVYTTADDLRSPAPLLARVRRLLASTGKMS
jgi:hypothetical protein